MSSDIYALRSTGVWIAVALFVLLVVATVLLVTGDAPKPLDQRGDLRYVRGSVKRQEEPQRQIASSMADVIDARVTQEGDDLLFEATMAAPIPSNLRGAALDLFWEVRSSPRWIVSATFAGGLKKASVTEQGTDVAVTSIPAMLDLDRRRVTVRFDPTEAEGFPESFDWQLTTVLKAFADEPNSPRVEDTAPNGDPERFETD